MASKDKAQPKQRDKQGTFQKLDEAYAESSMEDQLLVYWNRHKNQILMAVVVAIVLVLGIQLFKWWSQKSVDDRGAAYAAATADSAKESFADKNSGTDLGGVAYLELGDKAYQEKEYSSAVSFYEKAFKSLDLVILKQRAHLGLALSRLKAGDVSVASKDLQSIADQADYPDVARAEALYHLSILAWEKGDFDSMLLRHEAIDELPDAGNWQRKAFDLQNTIPELKERVEAKASDDVSLENLQPVTAN